MLQMNAKLTGVLLLQLIAAASLYLFYTHEDTAQANMALLDINRQLIDQIEIKDKETEVVLKKDNDRWQMPNWHQLPVNPDKLDSVLKQLAELKSGWPIATSSSSHQRFEVAEDKFQRRITLKQQGQPIADFFLGTSPGFRKVHFRLHDDNKVYSVALNSYDFPVKFNDWLWKKLLAVQNIKRIQGSDFTLEKTEQGWQLKDDGDIPVDQEKAQQLVQAFNGLTVSQLAEDEVELSEMEKLSFQVENDSHYTLTFYHKDNDYYVQRNDYDSKLFKLTPFEFRRFADLKKDDLIKRASETAKEQSADKANSSGNEVSVDSKEHSEQEQQDGDSQESTQEGKS
jgi:hypothetical protein